MTRLCIGTVFKILSLSKRGGVSDKALGEVIFGGPYGENLNDAAINRIKNCVRDITDKAKENFSQWETEEKLDMANDIINNYLDANLLKETVLALQATVVEDDTINSSTIIGFDSKYKKASIERMSEFNFTSFLANVISYTYFNGHNAGNEEYSKRINKEFLKSFSEETRKIILVESVDKEELGNYQAVGVNKDNLDEYYVKLWLEYHENYITRNGDSSKKAPLINMMVLPDIRDDRDGVIGEKLENPFYGRARVQYVHADSGIGKSYMLWSIIVVCIVDYIYTNHLELMCEDEIRAYKDNKFSDIERFYFGNEKKNRIPVYIKAANFNEYGSTDEKDYSEKNLLMLSENYNELNAVFNFLSDEFLFLIDSLDEIEESNVNNFNVCLYNLIGQVCEKNPFIITSRFSGRSIHIEEMEYLRLGGFDMDAIHSYLRKCWFLNRRDELKNYIDNNEYAYKLAQNPFMLSAMLDIKSEFTVKNILDKITEAIIKRRMSLKVLAMNEDEIRAVLSYLAFYLSFCEEEEVIALEKIHINNIIKKARDNGLLTSVLGYSVDISDEQIDTFTNTISCQSGIITLIKEGSHIKFKFQDELVMCYLAAEFVDNLPRVADDLPKEFYFTIENGDTAISHNVYEISRFWDNFRSENSIFSKRFCQIINLIIQITGNKTYGRALIYYMLLKGFTAVEEKRLANIKNFFAEYSEKIYGDKDLFREEKDLRQVTTLIDRLFKISN